MPPFIQTERLTLSYGGKTAFDNITLSVAVGGIAALIGPSGCGKSSFLLSLCCLTDLIHGCRVTGSIRIGGLDVLSPKTDTTLLRLRVGMIFQKPNPFPLSIWKNISLPLRERGIKDRREVDYRVEKALKDVGLWNEVKHRLNVPALALSGGQKQLLCIARVLALEPEALLFDEPFSALDPFSSALLEDLIISLRKRCTVLVVTHNLAQARRVADYVALFWTLRGAGRLIEYGTVEQVFESPRNELTKAYIEGLRG